MWMLDKIKSSYRTAIDNILEYAIDLDSIWLAKSAVFFGAKARSSINVDYYGYEYTAYTSLLRCKSEEMLSIAAYGCSIDKNSQVEFAVQNEGFLLTKYSIALLRKNNRNSFPEILRPDYTKSEKMQDFLIDIVLKDNKMQRTNQLYACLYSIKEYPEDEEYTNIRIKFAEKLLQKGVDIRKKITSDGDTVEGIAATIINELGLWPYQTMLDFLKKIVAPTPLVIDAAANKDEIAVKSAILDRYKSIKGLPLSEHIATESNENRLFLPLRDPKNKVKS